jgi:molybdopterin-guanine dinucleotide biosynthesis protein A
MKSPTPSPSPVCRAAILAGGQATRMGGRNKALIEVDGRAILDRQLDVLARLFAAGDVAVVIAAGDGPDGEAPYAARGLVVLRDRVSSQGPLAGLAAALSWADGAPLFALACDMPHVDVRVVELILARTVATGADIALPVAGGKFQPLIACYSTRCRALVDRELAAGRRRVSALPDVAREAGLIVHAIDEEEIRTVDPYLRSFANLNSASDLL